MSGAAGVASPTLFLAPSTWDLALDVNGNIAVAQPGYALAQDAASAIRTFRGEAYYDTTLGVPFLTDIFAGSPPLGIIKLLLENAALTVPGVGSAAVFITSVAGRVATGQVQVTPAVAVSIGSGAAVVPDAIALGFTTGSGSAST